MVRMPTRQARRDVQAKLDTTSSADRDWLLVAGQMLVILKVAVALIVFDPRSFDAFGLPKVALGHALSFVLAGVILLLLVRHGLSIVPWTRLHVAVGALDTLFAI